MARPRKKPPAPGQRIEITVPPAPVTEPEDTEDDLTPEEAESQEDVEDAAAEAPRRAEVRIYRSHPAGPTREAYTDTVDAASFRTDMLRENYGGGNFRLDYYGVARGNKTKEGWGKLKTRRVLVDTTIPPKHPAALAAATHPVPAPPAAAGSSALDQALVGMLINMMQQSQEMSKMQAAMMADHSRVIASQIAEMSERRQETKHDPIELLKTAADFIKGNVGPAAQSPVSMLKELLEVKELLGGDSGPRETSAVDVIKEFAPPILDTINRALDRPGAPAPAAGPVHAPNAALASVPNAEAEPAQPVTVGGITVSMMWQQFAKWVPNFTRWATQKRPPAWVAETMLLEIPEGYHDALLGMLSPETMVEETVSRFPPLAPFQSWLAEVRTEAISMLTATPDDGDDSPD